MGERGSDVNDGIDPWDVFQRHGTIGCTSALRTFYSGLQVGRDQVVNGHGGKPIAERLVAFANASNVMAPHRTDNNARGEHKKGSLRYIDIPPNSITFSQKLANDVGTNKARGTSNLPVSKPVNTLPLQVNKWGSRTRTIVMIKGIRRCLMCLICPCCDAIRDYILLHTRDRGLDRGMTEMIIHDDATSLADHGRSRELTHGFTHFLPHCV
jgi:hypothetical protein